jgi:NAD(P)-dependent dehydrogenase (short-subunit alcohol dehydrogenase family)
MRLADRVAIVTGGCRGLGLAYSHALSEAGAKVVMADIFVDVSNPPLYARIVECDVSNPQSVENLVQQTIAEFGRIDILVNNAAVFSPLRPVAVSDLDVALWDHVMAVNVRGPFLLAKYVAPHMIARKYGKIINISSGVAYKGMPQMAHYSTSKAALLGLTRSLSRELGEHNICVNSLAPGLILSDTILANTEHLDRYRAAAVGGRAMKRDAYPRDVIGTVLFLASSPDSDFVTGQTIAVDGGSVNT